MVDNEPLSLPPKTVVIRGGLMTSQDMMDNALAEYRKSGRWALSVGAKEGLTASQIAAEWPYLGKHFKRSTVDLVEAGGFSVIPDGQPDEVHALLMLGQKPTEETWERVRECFPEPEERNPSYKPRRRTHG